MLTWSYLDTETPTTARLWLNWLFGFFWGKQPKPLDWALREHIQHHRAPGHDELTLDEISLLFAMLNSCPGGQQKKNGLAGKLSTTQLFNYLIRKINNSENIHALIDDIKVLLKKQDLKEDDRKKFILAMLKKQAIAHLKNLEVTDLEVMQTISSSTKEEAESIFRPYIDEGKVKLVVAYYKYCFTKKEVPHQFISDYVYLQKDPCIRMAFFKLLITPFNKELISYFLCSLNGQGSSIKPALDFVQELIKEIERSPLAHPGLMEVVGFILDGDIGISDLPGNCYQPSTYDRLLASCYQMKQPNFNLMYQQENKEGKNVFDFCQQIPARFLGYLNKEIKQVVAHVSTFLPRMHKHYRADTFTKKWGRFIQQEGSGLTPASQELTEISRICHDQCTDLIPSDIFNSVVSGINKLIKLYIFKENIAVLMKLQRESNAKTQAAHAAEQDHQEALSTFRKALASGAGMEKVSIQHLLYLYGAQETEEQLRSRFGKIGIKVFNADDPLEQALNLKMP